MWHQFGTMPTDPDMGIFMEIDDIPRNWLQTHYEVVTGSSIYNNYNPAAGPSVFREMKSFSWNDSLERRNEALMPGGMPRLRRKPSEV